MRLNIFVRGHDDDPMSGCPYFVACDRRCSLADERFWRPTECFETTTCCNPLFVHCPRFLAASRPLRREDEAASPGDSPNFEAERTLSWIGVGALSCVGGVIISALAFLLLPAPQTAGIDLESQVAGAIATASPGPTVTRCGAARDQMIAAAQGTEILQPIPPIDSPIAEVETEPELPSAASEARPSGAPAAGGETTHVIAQGETLWAIARANGMDAGKLAARNGLPADALLAVGDVLVIPAAGAEAEP